MTHKIRVIVDSNERGSAESEGRSVADELIARDIPVERKPLACGDVLFADVDDQPLWIVERKEASDFWGTIKGRNRDQQKRLDDFRRETGCKVMYLHEGTWTFKRKHNPPAMQTSAIHMMVMDGFYQYFSKDMKESGEVLHKVYKSLTEHPYGGRLASISYVQAMATAKRGKQEANKAIQMLCALPGCTPATAEAIAEELCGSADGVDMRALVLALEKMPGKYRVQRLADLKRRGGQGRRVGPALAKSVLEHMGFE